MVTHVDAVARLPDIDPVAVLSLDPVATTSPLDAVATTSPLDPVVLAQTVDPAAGTLLQYVGTFVVATLFYAVTAHVAARYVLGETPPKLALGVGAAPAFASILLQQYRFLVIAGAALLLDLAAFHALYRIRIRTAAIVTVMHFTISVIVGVALSTLLAFALA